MIWRLVERNGGMATTNSVIVIVVEDYYRNILSSSIQADPEFFLADFEPKVIAFMN